MSYNKVILVGNLTRDPELRYLPSGSAVCNTAIATNRRYKSQSGEQKEEVCFVDLAFFGRSAEVVNQYLSRGSKILVEGRLKLDQWTDQSGAKRSKHSVNVDTMQMLDGKQEGQQQGQPPQRTPQQQSQHQAQQPPPREPPAQYEVYDEQGNMKQQGNLPPMEYDDSEIPF